MQVKLKINNDDDTLSYVNVKLSPVEWLLIRRAIRKALKQQVKRNGGWEKKRREGDD